MLPIACPQLGVEEKEAVLQVLASGHLAQGIQVARFENAFAGVAQVQEAVAVSSGTAALYLALLAHGIGVGDEVITTAFSFVATANTILAVGAIPVFVDIEPDTYTLNPVLVEAAITSRTKALLPVHLYGHPCDMESLLQIAEAHGLVMIEDACQAHAASIHGKPVGSFGTGCFSFYATKNITTGEGGMVTTNDHAIAERIRLLRNHGQAERYCHVDMGYNLRMTDIQGALGVVQLERLEQFTRQRIAHAACLTRHLADALQTPVVRSGYRHVYHQYTVQVPRNRDMWLTRLHERGIGAAIHYPVPIHLQPFYTTHKNTYRCAGNQNGIRTEQDGHLPITEHAARHVLSLPIHPALTEENLVTIAKEVLELCQ